MEEVMAERPAWVEKLLAMDTFTVEDAGKVSGCYGPDVITKLRHRSDVVVEVVGDDGSSYRRKIYRAVERDANGWIPISTLPPANHPVLVYWDGVMVVTSWQTEVTEHWRGYRWLEPSHWMELPTPPLH